MAPSGLSAAPQELIEEIIDYHSGDKKTLIACSLTSRAWVPRTRKHLFSKLTLTDETLPVWCGIVVTPTAKTGPRLHPPPNSDPPLSSSYASHWLSSYVTSLKLVPKYSPTTPNNLGAKELLRTKSHLSAFTQLKSLTLTAISFADFDDSSLEACFGSLAETVHELKLGACSLDKERLSAFLRLFTRLESLEVDGNVWAGSRSTADTKALQRDLPTLRGSFKASDLTDRNDGLLDSLVIAKVEYHTITLGYNHPATFPKFNALFAKCKNHLKTLSLTALEWNPRYVYGGGLLGEDLSLSSCKKLVEIRARFNHAEFGKLVPILETVVSPQFRKLMLLITPPIPVIGMEAWKKLDEEVTALVGRINATAVNDRLEVLFLSYSTGLGLLVRSDVERALPRMASDARVSLRVENLPLPLNPLSFETTNA